MFMHGRSGQEFSRANSGFMRQTKWLSEQVNADGPLNGSDRERAVKGSTLEKEMTQKQ